MAQRRNGFQCHVAASLNRPFVILFQKDRAHEAEDGGFIGKDPHDIGSPLDLSIETFDRIGGVDLRPVVFREGGVGEDVLLGLIHEICEFPNFWAQLVANPTPFGPHRLGVVLGEGGADEGAHHAFAALVGMGQRDLAPGV